MNSNFFLYEEITTPDGAEKFYDWMMDKSRDGDFPLEVYVEGISYRFLDDLDVLYFLMGWDFFKDLALKLGNLGY